MSQESIEALLDAVRSLQTSGNHADFKIRCKGQVFSAHKAIICSRSEFFRAACTWPKVGYAKDEVDLDDEDPRLVKLMVDYLYQMDYNDLLPPEDVPLVDPFTSDEHSTSTADDVGAEHSANPRVAWYHGLTSNQSRARKRLMKTTGTWEDRVTQNTLAAHKPQAQARRSTTPPDPDAGKIIVNAGMYALADKYGIEALKSLAKSKFSDGVNTGWRSEEFVRGADMAFSNTPSSDTGLRDIVISTLLEHKELTDYEEVQTLLDSGNGMAWLLLKVLLSRGKRPASYRCETCGYRGNISCGQCGSGPRSLRSTD